MKKERILVTGGTSMVGRNLKAELPYAEYTSSREYNLKNETHVKRLMAGFDPPFDRVIHLAGKVGGLIDNMDKQYDYYCDNILMNSLILEYARISSVKRFTAILSTCIFPSIAKIYPMTEEMMHDSAPSSSNYGYAIAKRAMACGIDCINQQYGLRYNYLIPCNLYGKFDKMGSNSHYVAALIKKIHEAKQKNQNYITLMGNGTPLRQFLYAKDLSRVIKLMIENDITESFNIASDKTYSIEQIARIALKACDAKNLEIRYENPHMNGQFRKDVDNSKFKKLFKDFKFTPLEEGIEETYMHFKNQNPLEYR